MQRLLTIILLVTCLNLAIVFAADHEEAVGYETAQLSNPLKNTSFAVVMAYDNGNFRSEANVGLGFSNKIHPGGITFHQNVDYNFSALLYDNKCLEGNLRSLLSKTWEDADLKEKISKTLKDHPDLRKIYITVNVVQKVEGEGKKQKIVKDGFKGRLCDLGLEIYYDLKWKDDLRENHHRLQLWDKPKAQELADLLDFTISEHKKYEEWIGKSRAFYAAKKGTLPDYPSPGPELEALNKKLKERAVAEQERAAPPIAKISVKATTEEIKTRAQNDPIFTYLKNEFEKTTRPE